jgi:hypothetical protein
MYYDTDTKSEAVPSPQWTVLNFPLKVLVTVTLVTTLLSPNAQILCRFERGVFTQAKHFYFLILLRIVCCCS